MFRYHRRKYGAIRSLVQVIVQGLVLAWIMVQAPTVIAEHFTSESDQAIVLVAMFVLLILLSFAFVMIPFGSVLQPISKTEFITYKQLGCFRWNIERWSTPGANEIKIVQGADRYFIIVIGVDKKRNVELDRFPTLDNATKYLEELRSVIFRMDRS